MSLATIFHSCHLSWLAALGDAGEPLMSPLLLKLIKASPRALRARRAPAKQGDSQQ